ncbi:MAG TPA: A24 family peptidase [Solirubrobacterales bacterium]|nr:A24 family peptidase [Solirubrobacterales bacterium]
MDSPASVGVALLVAAGFLSTAEERPLLALAWAAAFLFLAVENDVRRLRIPNWLTFPAFLGALAIGFASAGGTGLRQALAGAGVAFGVLLVPYALRWLGAGDVKAAMVLGALFGRETFLLMLFWMVLVGGCLAIALVVVKGGLRDLLRRWFESARQSVLLRRPVYFGPAPGSPAAAGLPFAVAMGLGATLYQVLGAPF